MEKEIKLVYEEDIIPTHFGTRTSARIITKEREDSDALSIHLVKGRAEPLWSEDIFYPNNDEYLYSLEGDGQILFGGKCYDFRPGTAVFIPKGCKYRMLSGTEHKVLVIMTPPRLRAEWVKNPKVILLEPEDAVRKK